MYAIVEVSGRQWKVEPGTRLDVNRVANVVGDQLAVEQVLLAHDGTRPHVGHPYIQGAKVTCEVVEHRQGPKEISYHFRRRENWRKTVGSRQPLTRLVVKDIVLPETSASAKPVEEVVTARAPKPRAPKATSVKQPRPRKVNPTASGG